MARGTRALLLGVLGCAVAFAVLLVVAYGSDTARWVDATALQGFFGLQRPAVDGLTARLVRLGDPEVVGVVGSVLAAVALGRGRPRPALGVIVLLAATSVSSQVLKAVLAYPRYAGGDPYVGPDAFPSGHATAAMSLALAGVLVAPARVRALAALAGSAFALAVSYSIVAQGWHFPSDVVGGLVLATGWALAIAAAVREADARWPRRSRPGRLRAAAERSAELGVAAGAVVAAAVALLVLVLLLGRLPELLDFAARHTALSLTAVAIAASAAALLTAVTLVLRRR